MQSLRSSFRDARLVVLVSFLINAQLLTSKSGNLAGGGNSRKEFEGVSFWNQPSNLITGGCYCRGEATTGSSTDSRREQEGYCGEELTSKGGQRLQGTPYSVFDLFSARSLEGKFVS